MTAPCYARTTPHPRPVLCCFVSFLRLQGSHLKQRFEGNMIGRGEASFGDTAAALASMVPRAQPPSCRCPYCGLTEQVQEAAFFGVPIPLSMSVRETKIRMSWETGLHVAVDVALEIEVSYYYRCSMLLLAVVGGDIYCPHRARGG